MAFFEDNDRGMDVLLVVGRGRRPSLAAAIAAEGEDEKRNISVGLSVTGFSA